MAAPVNFLNGRQFATLDDMQRVFMQHQPQLEWFGYFITGDERVAEACVVDARALSISHNQVFQDWLLEWARYATIQSAIQAQRQRGLLQASAHREPVSASFAHERLPDSVVEFVEDNTEVLIKRLDALSRVALVVYGIEKHSLGEAAILAGVSTKRMRAAYSAAMDSIEVLQCEELRAEQNFSTLHS